MPWDIRLPSSFSSGGDIESVGDHDDPTAFYEQVIWIATVRAITENTSLGGPMTATDRRALRGAIRDEIESSPYIDGSVRPIIENITESGVEVTINVAWQRGEIELNEVVPMETGPQFKRYQNDIN